ncbi:hypothetical protein V8C42DRAFT_333818 [Trichoderma barbatum]
MPEKQPPYHDPKKAAGNSSGNRPGQGSSKSGKNLQGYSMERYVSTPHRHETWDWEKKAKQRSDKNTRL